MAMPEDFTLLNPKKFINHVCQNVPVTTATDMANEIKAVLEGQRQMIKSDMIYQYNAQQRYDVEENNITLSEFFVWRDLWYNIKTWETGSLLFL